MTWNEAFESRYDEWAAHMTEDVAFYVDLAREADGPIVELAVGSGRVAIPVAEATGKTVIGLDISATMLEQARERARVAGVDLELRHADMRELSLEEPAALIYCPFRALFHLPTWDDRRTTFERVAGALLPGGRFAWNVFAFDHRAAARVEGVRQNEPVPHTVSYAVSDNASTSGSITVPRVRCGGRRRTSGSACSTSRACSSKRCTEASTDGRLTTPARSACS
jgi:ubiquinone/menaquinone biosynthesis C-methylase UbiE